MAKHVVFFSLPHLRPQDVDRMPSLAKLRAEGNWAALVPEFPAVTWPAQVAMMTGAAPNRTGIPGNGIYWKDEDRIEMWIYWNELIQAPQLWDELERQPEPLTSAAWFPLLSKGATATYGIAPKPKHNPDGTETMWCWTRPEPLYEELLKDFGHFPLHHFWGPLSSIKASEWIADSALWLFERKRPNFMNIYIPHLDYEAQKTGPDSPESLQALEVLDRLLERVFTRFRELEDDLEIIVAGEYVITPVSGPVYPNILLREEGYLTLVPEEGGKGELLATGQCRAWALCDHQVAHVYVKDPADVPKVADLFRRAEGIERVLAGDERRAMEIDHPRAGDIVLIAEEDKWFAYPWWTDEAAAPSFASRVDIHRKPGYDPVELFMNPFTKKIALDASLIKGSHGRTGDDPKLHTVLIRSQKRPLPERLHQRDVYGLLLEALGVRRA